LSTRQPTSTAPGGSAAQKEHCIPCTKSGWFDQFQFEKWFEEVLLPRARRKVGKKLLLGDNLASHISPGMINNCHLETLVFLVLLIPVPVLTPQRKELLRRCSRYGYTNSVMNEKLRSISK
jgi:hypothetical protein